MSTSETPTSIKDLLKLVLIDKNRGVSTSICLKDPDGDEVDISEIMGKLTDYVSDKMKDEGENSCKQQIMPLMAQGLVSGMTKYMGQGMAAVIISDEMMRHSLIHMMTTSFYLLKFIQQKNIKIYTTETPVTSEEIEMYERCSRASDFTMKYASMGGDPRVALKEMLKKGLIKKSDLTALGESEDDTEN